MYLLYDLLLLASTLFLVPFYLLRGLKYGKARRGIRERLGFYAPGRLEPLMGRKVIWVHAVSVGETRAALPLLKALKETYPEAALVVSNVTETGHAVAGKIGEVDLCLFFPFDLSWAVLRVLRQVRPALVVIVETEIWPNFARLASRTGVPVALVNGRISDRSFPRYRLARFLLRPVLEQFSAFCMQTRLDADRIRELGATGERVEVTGNLKFDMQAAIPGEGRVRELKQSFCLPEDALIWVAGSTHAGEEEEILGIYRELAGDGGRRRKLVLVLVPRHPERCAAVGEMLDNLGIGYRLRSSVDTLGRPLQAGEVLLVDTVGEMLKFYAVSDLVFVGGSLVPVGGHNILEASLLKKPVLFGPYMNNFKEISRLLLEAGGGIGAADVRELSTSVCRLLDEPRLRRDMGEAGYALLRENTGATDRTLATLRRLLETGAS